MNKLLKYIILSLLVVTYSCDQAEKKRESHTTEDEAQKAVAIPDFNADSAYTFVRAQDAWQPGTP